MTASALDRFVTPAIVLDALLDRVGAERGISAKDFTCHLYGSYSAYMERHLRRVIEALRRDGHPVAGTPATGYFYAETEAELNDTCEFLYGRAMTTLTLVAAMKRVALPDLRGQLNLPVEKGEPA
jgi:hypothetical protein